jgi:hypothetical protein
MHVYISFGLPSELLAEIEKNIKGKTRNAKLLSCVEVGYAKLTESCKVKPTTHTEQPRITSRG